MSATSDFLEKVFKIQRITEWRFDHPEQYQQFCDWAGDGTDVSNSKLNTDQRKWLKYLQRTGPNDTDPFEREGGDKKGFIKIQDFPPAADLDTKDPQAWENLYTICRNAWYQMKHDAAYAGYKDSVKQFIANNARFFDDVAEDTMTAQALTRTSMDRMVDLLDRIAHNTSALSRLGIGYGNKITSLRDLRQKITDEKYNTDSEIRQAIMEISSKVCNAEGDIKTELDRAVHDNFAPLADLNAYANHHHLDLISDGTRGWNRVTNTAAQLDNFKLNYVSFVRKIYSDDDVYQAFESKEGGNKPITSAITKAKTDVDYDKTDSANYVPPKREEQLTLFEQIKKWSGDTFSDYFKKYEGLRGTKILEHYSEVNEIVKQMDKAEIKPTDDLNKLVEKSDGIKKVLQSKNPYAAAAFGWLADALKDFQGDARMSQIMKGALKNGRKMKMLVAELIERAAEDGKKETIDKAKIALELLSVIKYGNTTSKIMDTLKEDKELFTIFSNEKLSWNKNEGVKFITNAMDKTFRAACLGLGRGAAFVVNRFRRRGTKFNGKLPSKKLSQSYRDWQSKNAADKASAQAAHDSDVTPVVADQSEFKRAKDKAEGEKQNAMDDGGGHGLRNMNSYAGAAYAGTDEEILRAAEEDINAFNADEYVADQRVAEYRELINKLYIAHDTYQELIRLDYEEHNVATSAMTPEQKTARITEIVAERRKLKKELKDKIGNDGNLDLTLVGGFMGHNTIDLMAEPRPVTPAWFRGATTYVENRPGYIIAQNHLNDLQNEIYTRQQHIETYRKATEDLKAAEEQITAREKKINEWDDKHQDVRLLLTAYWDTLQDPSLTRFGPRRASKIQEQNKDLVSQLYHRKLAAGYALS